MKAIYKAMHAAALFTCCFVYTAQAQHAFNTAPGYEAPVEAVTEARWAVFSRNIAAALDSEHEGLQQGALRMVIQHGNQIDVEAVRPGIMRICWEHENSALRRMAVVALSKIPDARSIDFLTRSVQTEKNPGVRQTMQAVVAEYELAQREQQAEKAGWLAEQSRPR